MHVNKSKVLICLGAVSIAVLFCGLTRRAATQVKSSSVSKADSARYQLAADYSGDYRGLSLLVIKGDKVEFEQYEAGRSADTPHMLASGTKSFVGVMAIAAVEDKLLKLDERVSDTITEWKSDARKSKITIDQLLHLVSGIEGGSIGRPPIYSVAITAEAASEPGTKFKYGPAPFQIFGEVMRRKLLKRNEGPLDYLKRRILDPIGLKVSFWQVGLDGNPHLPSGAFLTAREWAKFGMFVRDRGKWNGKQIISAKLFEQCFVGSKANPAYGLTFWLNAAGGAAPNDDEPVGQRLSETSRISQNGIYARGPKDLFMAAGAGKQRLYIIPSLNMVVVRQGRLSRFDDAEFLARLLDGKTADGVAALAGK